MTMGYMDYWSPYDELYGNADTENDTSYLGEEEYPTADQDYEGGSTDVD